MTAVSGAQAEVQESYQGWAVDFAQPPGELALLPPDSVQWRIYKNPIALAIGGVAAVLLEFADPRIRSGVWNHSVYPTDPIGRSKRTGLAALIACYGPHSAARSVIGRINQMHGKVKGVTPGGEAYRALDPELLDWVAATASYGFLMAYDQYVSPISAADKDRFFRDGEAIDRAFGARHAPHSLAEFHAMAQRLEHRFEPHPIIGEFLAIIQSGKAASGVPKFVHRALSQAAVGLLPVSVRQTLELGPEYDLGWLGKLSLKLLGRLADRKVTPDSPPCQASVRLGLPHDFLYRPRAEQHLLLARQGLAHDHPAG